MIGKQIRKAILVRFNPMTDLHIEYCKRRSQIEPRQYHFLLYIIHCFPFHLNRVSSLCILLYASQGDTCSSWCF
uniref:Uncharacterized protein n=1 Tax=Manihot esculenta TaxID=3983 RepID=A0A2C9VN49_MANES